MRIALLFLCLFLSVSAIAQKNTIIYPPKEQLEARKKELMAEIKETEDQLNEIKSKKGTTLAQLQILQNQLAVRQRYIENINDQLDDIETSIKTSSREVLTLKQKLEQYKIRYAQSLRYAYETRSSYDMLAFLFSSRDFNDAMRRMKYLKKFRDFRKQQVEQIYMTQTQLQHKIGTLNAKKEDLVTTQKEKVEQTQKLKDATEEQNHVMQELKGKESELLMKIERDRVTANKVNKAIQHYIEQEIERAEKAAAAEEEKRRLAEAAAAKANAPKPTAPGNEPSAPNNTASRVKPAPSSAPELLLTPTDVALASNFEGNKGKMYWPVERGYIIDHFGTHPHPVEQKVMIENYGVTIQTDENASVRSVFDGTVSKVFSTLGSAQIVMITHGNYYTVYNGLASVSVREGEKVSTRQVIGRVAVNDDNVPTINFQIWKSGAKKMKVKLNPEQWLGKAH